MTVAESDRTSRHLEAQITKKLDQLTLILIHALQNNLPLRLQPQNIIFFILPIRIMDTRPKSNEAKRLILRTASKADLDDTASVAQAAFPVDAEWNYRFPYRKEYPEDNCKWTRNEYEDYLDQPDKYAVLVVTATVKTDSKVKSKPIAIAVWDISVLTKSTGGVKYYSSFTVP